MNKLQHRERYILGKKLRQVALALCCVLCLTRNAAAQVIAEFRVPSSGQPIHIAPGPGGMWFTEDVNRIGRITPEGRVSEFPVNRPAARIVTGPDGNLWFTSDGFLSRMTPAGVVTDFPLAGSASGITVGPDRNIWFTEVGSSLSRPNNYLGRATTDGQITEFLVEAAAGDITVGPDGNFWVPDYTEAAFDAIVRVTPSGLETRWPLRGRSDVPGDAGPFSVVVGSDGNIWFTEAVAGKIGRISASGDSLIELAVESAPFGIASGPDGNLWFTEPYAQAIGRMTTGGDSVEFAVPTPGAQPLGISAGPDGNIWFTESGASRIGRVALRGTRDAGIDLSVGADGKARVLRFDPATGLMALDSVDEAGSSLRTGPFGPYPGWTARRTASGSDGLTRVLWTNDDGSASLWLLGRESNQGAYRLGPVAGFTAVDVAASIPGTTHLLWTDAGGRIALWSVDNEGQVSAGQVYGPYAAWNATAIADGQDGLTRVLWNRADGSAALALFGAAGLVASHPFGPVAGWRAVDIAVGADGQTRILWTHQDGRMALWRVDGDGNPTALGPIYPPPPGFTASRIAAGSDGLTRALWSDADDNAILWTMSADNVFQGSFSPGPVDVIAGAWTGKFDSADFVDCDSNTPAQASFTRKGENVVGTLSATENFCGFGNVTFQGTLRGSSLSGTIQGDRFTGGSTASGTLSGAALEITLNNSFGFIPGGQMHLHRQDP